MGDRVLIWAGTAAEAQHYVFVNNMKKDDYRYVYSLMSLRGYHGQSIIKIGTYYKSKDAWFMEQMIDDKLGEVI